MTPPKSLGAYTDCEEYFEKAAASEKGIGLTLETPGMALRFRQKMNSYRIVLRKQSKAIYEIGEPKYNTSPYDAYELTIDKENDCRVLIRKYRMSVAKVEELE